MIWEIILVRRDSHRLLVLRREDCSVDHNRFPSFKRFRRPQNVNHLQSFGISNIPCGTITVFVNPETHGFQRRLRREHPEEWTVDLDALGLFFHAKI
jgi:hypothetical protein